MAVTRTLRVRGQREPVSPAMVRGGPPGTGAEGVTDLLDAVKVVDAFSLSPSARGRAEKPETVEVDDSDILEIAVEGGFTMWTSVGRYREEAEIFRPEAVDGDLLTVDAVPSAGERGAADLLATALRVLRLGTDRIEQVCEDPSTWPPALLDKVKDLGVGALADVGEWLVAKAAIRLIEDQLRPGPGLYRWLDATTKPTDTAPVPLSASDIPADEPLLLFIHGTASSTVGSFGAFCDQEAKSDWGILEAHFKGRIFAFEHATMSASPIENAIQLATALPRRARLSLVSHSRGGLVADLLCLPAISEEQIGAFRRPLSPRDPQAVADAFDRKQLRELAAVLADKQLRVERVVRCASPARGTLLASENTDQFLSVLTNLVGLIPGLAGNPLYEVVKRITLQVVKRRWEPRLVPGVEAMTAASPLVRLINTAEPVQGTLAVISGDIEGGTWLKRLGVFLSDRFIYERRDNDLVVNTDAMFHGLRRLRAFYVFDQGADVSHFNYFRSARTRAALRNWLTATDDAVPGFQEITEPDFKPVPMARSRPKRTGASQPVVFVLPGIMGSQLEVGNDRVWLHHGCLLAGRFGDLNADQQDVKPTTLLREYYHELCEYLADTHEVIPFAYDWRKSLKESAERFAAEVDKRLGRTEQPIRIIAHSTGGLVVRQLVAAHPTVWDRLCEHPGGRLVMLGTPNRGSHSMVEALLGTAETVRRLALLDVVRGPKEIALIVARFPGVLELLPRDGVHFEHETWLEYERQWGDTAVPTMENLAAAKRVCDALPEDIPQAERVLYVAGQADRTVRSLEVVGEPRRVVLDVTTEGDGRVTYASGRLPGVRTWYMDATHGDLPAYAPGFPALVDLLERGTTNRLATAPPSVVRGGEVTSRTMPEPVLYPTREDLVAGVLGKRRGRRDRPTRPRSGFKVSVVHGDLRFARYPIVVGHYEGDTIVGAEDQIDHLLKGALSTRYNLGLYPGPLGTVSVVLRQPGPLERALNLPTGAIVIGLGNWGELTAAQLANLIRQAALQFVLQLDDCTCDQDGERVGIAARSGDGVGMSLLLIGGSSTANISTHDSVGAILRGIAQANAELAARLQEAPRVAEVEIIELFADTAIEAASAAKRLAASLGDELQTPIEAAPLLQRGREGRQRLMAVGAREPWRRWEITAVPAPDSCVRPRLPKALVERLKRSLADATEADAELVGALTELALDEWVPAAQQGLKLRFISLSERARAEVLTQERQPELIERLIRTSIAQTAYRPSEARALFELMIPNDLKDGLGQLSRVVFVVDGETAHYPWELMLEGQEPLCTRIGMIRQLQTQQYRPQIRATTARTAYVVGDPSVSPPYRQLPGARKEAERVYELLRGRFDVQPPREQPTALEVLGDMFAKAYQILHLAGHGYYEPPTTRNGSARSGMVLDNGLFLTAVEIGQMRQVPELVFLNCCHIGQVGPDARAARPATEFNRLAASVSRELIEMGVRAVVAAGWAVRDDAGLFFAEQFYAAMLDGRSFGRALQEARQRTWQRFGEQCNTWGAYQAYGDPDFRLRPDGGSRSRDISEYVDTAELVDVLTQLRRRSQREGRHAESDRWQRDSVAELDVLAKRCPADWLAQTEVAMAFGLAYGEVAQFEKATAYLERALVTEELDAKTTLHAAEQLANFEARLGVKLASGDSKRGRGLIDGAIRRLERLAELGETGERHALLGSAYRRLAQIGATPAAVRLALAKSTECYRAAHEWNQKHGQVNPYPLLNWLLWSVVLARPRRSRRPIKDLDALLARCEGAARERHSRTRDVFDLATEPDAAVVRALASKVFEGKMAMAEVRRIAGLYRQAFRRGYATTREVDSVMGQLEGTADILGKLAGAQADAGTIAVQTALGEIRRQVAGEEFPAPTAEVPAVERKDADDAEEPTDGPGTGSLSS